MATRIRRHGTGDVRAASQRSSNCERACRDGEGFHLGPVDRYSTESLDRAFKAHLARFTLGITPFGLSSTVFAWWIHLLGSPGKQAMLTEKAWRKFARLTIFAVHAMREPDLQACVCPLPNDHRFSAESWHRWPYNLFYQNFLLAQQWWHNATMDIDGLSERQERVISFLARQLLDIFSPSNFIWTNPDVAEATLQQGGANLARGFQNLLEDWERAVSGKPPAGAENFRPGREVAVTPGKVVFRNDLIELIQYGPSTRKVKSEPVLIVPAWIMKYYILDLSPNNSLVRYLVEQGFTVFMISWCNPTSEQRDLAMADYLEKGVGAALGAINAIIPDRRVHGVGYCIGGTLLSIAAAAMARDDDDRLKTLTLFATQTDFTDAGELMLFISESQVAFLDDLMWDQGYLDTKQMAGAFQLLRSSDLIWSRYVGEYLLGNRPEMFDLMAWNADATRMPYRMHTEYLQHIFLGNELAQGKYEVDGRSVAISDIDAPVFCVSTTTDHVAPWQSVYKIHLLADTEVTFVLTTGGHNAGIVSEPERADRQYWIHTTREGDNYLAPEIWQREAEAATGSWWPAWIDWLAQHSAGETSPPSMGSDKEPYKSKMDAPGSYILQK